jgi:ParB family chromosome partitioning protein
VAAPKKKALGRGLEALIRDAGQNVPAEREAGAKEQSGEENSGILYINVDLIKPNSMQPRMHFDDEALEGLAQSIKENGVIQPIILKKASKGYELVAGERRWRAARKASLKEIPAIIKELTEEENALFAIIENTQREDLNPLEEAEAFRRIMDSYGLTQEDVSRSVGKSRPYIANVLRLLKLPEIVRESVSAGSITLGHANALGMVKDEQTLISLAGKVVALGLSVRETERLAAATGSEKESGKASKPVKPPKTDDVLAAEEELTGLLGTKVTIEKKKKGGSIVIDFYSLHELNGLIDELRTIHNA